MPKKKKEIDLNSLDINTTLQEAVACSILGRILASFGAILTGREKQDAQLVYRLLQAGKTYSQRLPVIASIQTGKKPKKYSPQQAINWFAENYPKEAGPLLAKLNENYNETVTAVQYGLKERRNLPDDYLVTVIQETLGIPIDHCRIMYHGVIKPAFERQEKESKLVSLAIKS